MSKSPIITDSGCLIALERIEHLDILSALFTEVWIPPAVAREFNRSLSWLKVVIPKDQGMITALKLSVDDGEAEAITLAYELQSILIVDDLQARKIAERLGLKITGTIGILITAKKKGIIDSVRSVIDSLESVCFYVSASLKAQALELAGEVGESGKPGKS